MSHITERLKEREIFISESEIHKIAGNCKSDTAILLQRSENSRFSKDESNGEMVILIVRNQIAVTVMFRRGNQEFSRTALRVDCIKTLY